MFESNEDKIYLLMILNQIIKEFDPTLDKPEDDLYNTTFKYDGPGG